MAAPSEDTAESEDRESYWLTRLVFLRGLGLVYAVAFLIVAFQWQPLLGSQGLLPAHAFLQELESSWGHGIRAFLRLPTLFWLDSSDAAFRVCGVLGLALSLAVLLGFANVPILAALWLLYMSFVHVGQIFYGYGWETLLLETGFLAIFLVPPWRLSSLEAGSPPSKVVIVLLRWLCFRLMFGAGLIKLRGDSCWLDLTCMVYHYETQPNPNPIAWYLHQAPPLFHAIEVLFNHLVELVVPFLLFAGRRARIVAGWLFVVFQALLILGGNLSFLNWLTLAIAVAAFDDRALRPLLTRPLRERLDGLADALESRARRYVSYALAAVVGLLSLNPVANMVSQRQMMNASFDPFDLVNTYGMFGSIGRERYEVVLEATADDPAQDDARWLEYDFKCKPGTPERRPCQISPYHYRLDWQMWFQAMPEAPLDPWLVHLVAKLLEGDAATRALLAPGPFETNPPRAIRARYYRYRFTSSSDDPRAWWRRTLAGEFLPALTRDDPRLLEFLRRQGWK